MLLVVRTLEGRAPDRRGLYRHLVIALIATFSKLGHFTHDAILTLAAVLAVLVLFAYWILKT